MVSFIVYLNHIYSLRPSDRELYTIDLTGALQAPGNHMVTHSLTHSLTYSLTYLLTYLLTYSLLQMQMTFNIQFDGVDENDVKENAVKWLDHLHLYTKIGRLLTHSLTHSLLFTLYSLIHLTADSLTQ
jgi:hypothetical protein